MARARGMRTPSGVRGRVWKGLRVSPYGKPRGGFPAAVAAILLTQSVFLMPVLRAAYMVCLSKLLMIFSILIIISMGEKRVDSEASSILIE